MKGGPYLIIPTNGKYELYVMGDDDKMVTTVWPTIEAACRQIVDVETKDRQPVVAPPFDPTDLPKEAW